MTDAPFGPWLLRLDPARTADATRALERPDPGCCNACATFLLAVERKALPSALVALLESAGADPSKPQEVWGVADDGFLNAWWVVAGSIQEGPTTSDAAEEAAMQLDGHRWWITADLAMGPLEGLAGIPVLQIELMSIAKDLKALEREAWGRGSWLGAI